MHRPCLHCNGTGLAPAAPLADIVEMLRATCLERGIWISPDEMVREADAATLIGWQVKTLRNRRYADAPIPFTMRQGRPLYPIAALADWLGAA